MADFPIVPIQFGTHYLFMGYSASSDASGTPVVQGVVIAESVGVRRVRYGLILNAARNDNELTLRLRYHPDEPENPQPGQWSMLPISDAIPLASGRAIEPTQLVGADTGLCYDPWERRFHGSDIVTSDGTKYPNGGRLDFLLVDDPT